MSFKGPIQGTDVCTHYGLQFLDWKAMDPSERALFRMAYAADVLHVEEDPRGSNTGPEVNRVLSIAGVGPGNPWCAAIWTAYLFDSGVLRASLPPQAASVHGWGQWASQHGRIIETPRRGCAALIYHTPTTGHLVVVADPTDLNNISCIAGNSNSDGSREGYAVCRKHYPESAFAVFVDCAHLGS